MQVTSRVPKHLLWLVTMVLFATGMLVGCSDNSSASVEAVTPAEQQTVPASPVLPQAQCITVIEEDAPIAGPATYVVQFASQEEYDDVVAVLKARGLTPAEGGNGAQVRFWVTAQDVSDFLSPADVADLEGKADDYLLITDYEEGACTEAV